MNDKPNLRIRPSLAHFYQLQRGYYWHAVDPDEAPIFGHFANGDYEIQDSRIPGLIRVAEMHGWTVTKEEYPFVT